MAVNYQLAILNIVTKKQHLSAPVLVLQNALERVKGVLSNIYQDVPASDFITNQEIVVNVLNKAHSYLGHEVTKHFGLDALFSMTQPVVQSSINDQLMIYFGPIFRRLNSDDGNEHSDFFAKIGDYQFYLRPDGSHYALKSDGSVVNDLRSLLHEFDEDDDELDVLTDLIVLDEVFFGETARKSRSITMRVQNHD